MINWKKSIILQSKSIAEAIKTLEISLIKICFVVNSKKEFLGTITDGDIRRALIKNYSLKSNLKNIINYKALKLDEKINKKIVIKKMKEREILYIPVLNHKKQIISVHSANDEDQEKKKIYFLFLVVEEVKD